MKVTLGGFIEAAGIERNLYTGSDVNSKWNLGSGGFPLPNSPNYYQNELRGSARQSRLSLLAQGQDDYAALAAYYEMDFLGGGSGTSGNSQESNSYNPRIRNLYATYETKDGWHLLAGQELEPDYHGQDGHNAASGEHTHDHRRAVRTRLHLDA